MGSGQTVSDDNKVEFRNKIMSLSAAALEVLHEKGYKTPAASGSEFWRFDGELLDERRRRIEAARFGQPESE
jgi:hypothetical protein